MPRPHEGTYVPPKPSCKDCKYFRPGKYLGHSLYANNECAKGFEPCPNNFKAVAQTNYKVEQ